VEAGRITALPILADLPPAEIDELAAVMTESEVEAGAPITMHGDFGYVWYAIEDGEAEVRLEGVEEPRILGPGETFGEIALFVTGRRTATVVARTKMRLLSLFEGDFRRLQARVPEFERLLRQHGGERLSQ